MSRPAGSAGRPAPLLLHGLGATRVVWRGWQGTAPDLPGHGAAPWLPSYDFAQHAAAVLPLLGEEPLDVVGHSMGGVVALALAAAAPERVRRVLGLGIKVTWASEEVAQVRSLAQRDPATYATRDEAVDRFLRVSGLAGLVERDDPMTGSGVVRVDDGWRLAQDPRTFGVGVPDMAALLAGVRCPVVLARGEHDPMVTHDELATLVPAPVTIRGLGHNAHVEDPAAVLSLLAR